MNTKKTIDTLWKQFRQSINTAYAEADKARDEDRMCLRDYAENISWSDDLARLLGRECAEERQHRKGHPFVQGFSIDSAAKLLIMENVAQGAEQGKMPSATIFMMWRQTAAESFLLGYLIREHLTPEWKQTVTSLDYSNLMQGQG